VKTLPRTDPYILTHNPPIRGVDELKNLVKHLTDAPEERVSVSPWRSLKLVDDALCICEPFSTCKCGSPTSVETQSIEHSRGALSLLLHSRKRVKRYELENAEVFVVANTRRFYLLCNYDFDLVNILVSSRIIEVKTSPSKTLGGAVYIKCHGRGVALVPLGGLLELDTPNRRLLAVESNGGDVLCILSGPNMANLHRVVWDLATPVFRMPSLGAPILRLLDPWASVGSMEFRLLEEDVLEATLKLLNPFSESKTSVISSSLYITSAKIDGEHEELPHLPTMLRIPLTPYAEVTVSLRLSPLNRLLLELRRRVVEQLNKIVKELRGTNEG